MSFANPYNQYQKNSVETATQTRLVIMLYDGAIRFCNQALLAMQARNLDQQSNCIGKAQAIIVHLQETLDMEQGGTVAAALETFYSGAYNALTDANVHDKQQKLQDVLHGLRELREAWVEVDRQSQARKAPTLSDLSQSSSDALPRQLAAV